jgi:hypothetical protein
MPSYETVCLKQTPSPGFRMWLVRALYCKIERTTPVSENSKGLLSLGQTRTAFDSTLCTVRRHVAFEAGDAGRFKGARNA